VNFLKVKTNWGGRDTKFANHAPLLIDYFRRIAGYFILSRKALYFIDTLMSNFETEGAEQTLARIAAAIDPQSSVPVSVQLRGALEYGIAMGDIPPNTRLPSVRRLAASLNLSPVTVSGVYAVLQERGHVEGRVGSGTFVADRAPPTPSQAQRLVAFERQIAELVSAGQALGLSRQDVAFRVSVATPAPANPVRILLLGTFRDATAAYAEDLRPYLADGDTVTAWSIDQSEEDAPPRADLIFCPHTLLTEAAQLFPGLPVVGMTLIPNEATRIALASIPPDADVAVVSFFDDFLSVMKSGIARFAPHIGRITAVPRDFDGLPDLLSRLDVLIHSTGADYLRDSLRPGQTAIEYRHTPDSHAVRSELLPAIEAARLTAGQQEPANEDK
jgi:GntR family transcriptional regulator